jgi:hypothetical protein
MKSFKEVGHGNEELISGILKILSASIIMIAVRTHTL